MTVLAGGDVDRVRALLAFERLHGADDYRAAVRAIARRAGSLLDPDPNPLLTFRCDERELRRRSTQEALHGAIRRQDFLDRTGGDTGQCIIHWGTFQSFFGVKTIFTGTNTASMSSSLIFASKSSFTGERDVERQEHRRV